MCLNGSMQAFELSGVGVGRVLFQHFGSQEMFAPMPELCFFLLQKVVLGIPRSRQTTSAFLPPSYSLRACTVWLSVSGLIAQAQNVRVFPFLISPI